MEIIQEKVNMTIQEQINYKGWPNCIRVRHDECELIVSTDIGPRILYAGLAGGQNFLHLLPEQLGKIGGNEWRIYGGHRLWLGPESIPMSYAPDNEPLLYRFEQDILTLTQPLERSTGMIKEMEISPAAGKDRFTVLHRLINRNLRDVEMAPWALSALAQGGRAILPQEPFGEGDDHLLPARSLALWQYTKMNDPRWIWGEKYIQALQDISRPSEQKIGLMNKQGWAAYCLGNEILVKLFEFDPLARYTDLGSNNEVYINGHFLEMETLGPLLIIPSGGMAEHREHWMIKKIRIGIEEEDIDQELLPLIDRFKKEIVVR